MELDDLKYSDTADDTSTTTEITADETAFSTEEAEALLIPTSKTCMANSSNSTSSTSRIRLPPNSPSRARHLKNLFGLVIAFMLSFTAYGSLQNLQSSLNYVDGLGLASLSVIYGCFIVSCLLAPLVIRTLGTKWTIVTCLMCYTLYTAANFYPKFYTLIPTAALLGFAAGPLWAAQGTYLTTLAMNLADVVNDVPETVINQFNGIFFLFFESHQIWGNLLSSVIFSVNVTREELNETALWKCGRNGTGKEGMNYDDPGEKKTQLLLGLYLAFGLLGGIVALLSMDTIRSNYHQLPDSKYLKDHLLEVVRLMLTPYISLLIPLMIYSGVEQAYLSGNFTKSFVSCAIGIQRVGYVMIVYGVTDAMSSFFIGRVEAYVGRKIIFTAGGVVNFFVIIWMLLWKAQLDANQSYQFYLMAAGWGFSDAVWHTQISSILGVLLPQSQEAAFASFKFWQSVGFAVSFSVSISNSVLVLYKLLTLLILLLISMILYYIVECVIQKEGL